MTSHHPHQKGRMRRITLLTIAALLAGVAAHWAWNSVGIDLFGLEPVKFKHIAAFETAIIAVLVLVRMIFVRRPHRQGP